MSTGGYDALVAGVARQHDLPLGNAAGQVGDRRAMSSDGIDTTGTMVTAHMPITDQQRIRPELFVDLRQSEAPDIRDSPLRAGTSPLAVATSRSASA